MDTLPSEFDIIVVGTGLIESIIAAAASRIGKRVLHIDNKNYYGGFWASFNLEGINALGECSNLSGIENDYFKLKNFKPQWHIPEVNPEPEAEGEEKPIVWTQDRMLKQSRKFNIDLAPKLQYARGDFVELLISSNIARYSEFRSVSRVLTYSNGLKVVPCSRSDVFSTNSVSAIEKRLLMKLLTTCIDSEKEIFDGYSEKTFETYLKDKQLSPDLINFIQHAIAMSTNETSCIDGVNKTKRFVNSVGRFGKTPFLYSMYGSGELPQAFCRMSAVFGGVYALNQPIKEYQMNSDIFKGLITGEQLITADHLVAGVDYIPTKYIDDKKQESVSYISRAVFITDKSIMESEAENLTLLLFPTENGKDICFIIEAASATGTCPKGLFITYMFMKQSKGPEQDFEYFVNHLFKAKESPKILWSLYYSVPDTNHFSSYKVSDNIYACPGPDFDLDYDESIKKAREIFESIYPGLEFLPRAPDPEEIIIGDDEEATEVTPEEGTSNTDA